MTLGLLVACAICAQQRGTSSGALLLLVVFPYLVVWLVLRALRNLAGKENHP